MESNPLIITIISKFRIGAVMTQILVIRICSDSQHSHLMKLLRKLELEQS